MGRPRREDARDTRREILDAALDLFAERGYHATSTRALAAAVGVRESALYHHFPSKEAVLTAILEEKAGERHAVLEAHLQLLEQLPLEELLTHLLGQLVALMQEPHQRKFMRFVLAAGPMLIGDEHAPWRGIIDRPRKTLQQIFQRLRRAGRIREDVEFEVFFAHLLGPLLLATNILWGEGKGPLAMPLRRFLREHVGFMVAALAPAPTTARGAR